ncbi:MAG: putative lipid II flippase FtsW [Microgenomates group bacterium]
MFPRFRKKRKKVVLRSQNSSPDWIFLGTGIFLAIFGLFMIGNVSAAEALREFGDKFYFLKLQFIWFLIGGVLFLIFYHLPLKFLKNISFFLLLASLFFLVIVLIPGIGTEVWGAKRWLFFGPVRFQPAELAKFSFLLWGAAFLTSQRNKIPFFIILGLISGLILLEPDLGTTVALVSSALVIYFLAGAPLWQMILLVLGGVLGGLGLIFSSSYRKERFLTFLNLERDPLGFSYHIRQILIAIGSGGIFGLGLGHSRQKYSFVPAVTTDSIFAIIAEELGFLGSLFLIFIYLFLIWRGLKIAKYAPDKFTQILAGGIIFGLGFQVLINLGSMTALLPLTGIPLPFISYGGSSLVLNLISLAILANISRQRKVIK